MPLKTGCYVDVTAVGVKGEMGKRENGKDNCLPFTLFPFTLLPIFIRDPPPRGVVGAQRRDAEELARLDDVGRETVAVDAAGVEPDGARPTPRRGHRPVAEERDTLAVINFVPGRALAARPFGAERAQLRQVFDRLLREPDAGAQPRVDDDVRPEFNVERERREEGGVTLAPLFEFGAAPLLRRLQLRALSLPRLQQRAVVVAQHRREARVPHEKVEYLAVLLALDDEVTNADQPVAPPQADEFDERQQLVVAAVYVADDDGARQAQPPSLPAAQLLERAAASAPLAVLVLAGEDVLPYPIRAGHVEPSRVAVVCSGLPRFDYNTTRDR